MSNKDEPPWWSKDEPPWLQINTTKYPYHGDRDYGINVSPEFNFPGRCVEHVMHADQRVYDGTSVTGMCAECGDPISFRLVNQSEMVILAESFSGRMLQKIGDSYSVEEFYELGKILDMLDSYMERLKDARALLGTIKKRMTVHVLE